MKLLMVPALTLALLLSLVAGCSDQTKSSSSNHVSGQSTLPSATANLEPGKADPKNLEPAETGSHESGLLGITMPDGATLDSSSKSAGLKMEDWSLPGSIQDATAAMRQALPIGNTLRGYEWCTDRQSATALNFNVWDWRTGSGGLSVMVRPNTASGTNMVTIKNYWVDEGTPLPDIGCP